MYLLKQFMGWELFWKKKKTSYSYFLVIKKKREVVQFFYLRIESFYKYNFVLLLLTAMKNNL